MAQKHLEEVITTAGLPADQVKQLLELPDDAKDFKADPFIAPIRTSVEQIVKNDPKFYEGINKENLPEPFRKQLETEQYGRSAAEVRKNILKAAGLKEDDFKELGEDIKKMEVFGAAFSKKLLEGKVSDKELQQKLIEANNKIQEQDAKIPEIEKQATEKANQTVADRTFDLVVLATLASVKDLSTPAKFLAQSASAFLKNKYGYAVDGINVELRQKDKTDLKVLTDNGTKELTLQQALLDWAKQEGVLKAAGSTTQTGTTTVDVNTSNKGLEIPQHVNDKTKAAMERDKKAAGTTA